MASRDTLDYLRSRLEQHRYQSVSRHFFVPWPRLSQVFAFDTIVRAVDELDCPEEDRIGLASAIQDRGLTTFAILVWMKVADAIVNFRRAGCLDQRLPIDEQTAVRVAPSFGLEFYKEYQWQFLPHFFSQHDDDVSLEPSVIIPILREVGPNLEGGFGTVTRVDICPDLHDLLPATNRTSIFIRKTLRHVGSEERRREMFKNEKRTLRLLNGFEHPNIIPLLYPYTQGQEYSFLFPCVDMDLGDLFKRDDRRGKFRWDFTFFSALYGLASALSCVHLTSLRASKNSPSFNGIGYHHDIRPNNILVNDETFILADFGLSRMKPAEQNSRTEWKAGAGDYLAPECLDKNFEHQSVGRAIDVWAMGCLLAEVFTYVQMGSQGLTRFCEARVTPSSFSNWHTSYFHDDTGHVKNSVLDWLESLHDDDTSGINKSVCHLILDLLVPADKRPDIAYLCLHLGILSVRAQFFATSEALTKIIENVASTPGVVETSMKLWFERERLAAFGRVLSLDDHISMDLPQRPVPTEITVVVDILKALFEQLQTCPIGGETNVIAKETETDASMESRMALLCLKETEVSDRQQIFETNVQNIIQRLWETLSRAQRQKAERLWVSSMIETHSTERLGELSRGLRREPFGLYQKGAAMAMMKQIRLDISGLANSDPDLNCIRPALANTVQRATRISSTGPHVGCYMGKPVIIEWMYYDDSWEKISPSERSLVMALKAQGFNSAPKPDSLRLLPCLGFYEQLSDDRPGYGFVYEIPQVGDTSPPKITTLSRLLKQSATRARTEPHLNQPLLEDKYHLAHLLASFLVEFHTIGWLHENFFSHYIVFFGDAVDSNSISPICSAMLREPYIVGLNKSRPGGNAWHTQGPSIHKEYRDYRHPDYATTERFRCSYDYYSLGLMLLEIGLWTPLSTWSLNPRYKGMRPHHFRDELVKTYVPRLGPRMGRVFRDIVKTLLTDELDPFPQSKDVEEEQEKKVFNRFFETILDPLTRLSEAYS